MSENISAWAEESKKLEPKIFSVTRLILLQTLAELGPDGASFREIVAALNLPESIIFVNLKALEELGCVKSEKIELDKKEMTAFHITELGQQEFGKAKQWLRPLTTGD